MTIQFKNLPTNILCTTDNYYIELELKTEGVQKGWLGYEGKVKIIHNESGMTEYEKSYKGHEYIDILNNCIERMKKLEHNLVEVQGKAENMVGA